MSGKKKDKNNNDFLKNNDEVECSPLLEDITITLQDGEVKIENLNINATIDEIIYVKNQTLGLYATTKQFLETILNRIGMNIDNPNYLKSVKELIQTQLDILKEYNNINIKTLLELSLDKKNETDKKTVTNMEEYIKNKRQMQQEKKDANIN